MKRLSATLALLCTSLLAASGAAWAGHVDGMFKTGNYNHDCRDGTLGSNMVICQTDNSALTVWREPSMSTIEKQQIGGVLDQEFRATDLTVTFVASPVYTGDAETDVIYQHGPLPVSAAGATWCNDSVSSLKCDQHYVRFESLTVVDRELACHESGHAVGLMHGNASSPALSNGDNSLGCMQQPIPYSNDGRLGTHNKQLINATY